MDFTPEEIKRLKENSVYLKYQNNGYSGLTVSSIEADLDAITEVSLETMPLIRFLKYLYDMKCSEAITDNQVTNLAEFYDIVRGLVTQVGSTYFATQHAGNPYCSGIATVVTEATLSSGALNDHPLFQPGAGYTYYVYELQCGTNMAAGAAQNYVLEFEDEDTGNVFSCNMLGRDVHWLHLNQVGPGDDKDFQVDIAGGSAAEHLFFLTKCVKHT